MARLPSNLRARAHVLMKASLLLCGALFIIHSASAQYTITEIPACDTGELGGLTDRGAMALTCFIATGSADPAMAYSFVPSLLDKSGLHQLGEFPPGSTVRAAGINRHNQVIATRGFLEDARAYLLTERRAQDLGTLGGSWAMARGINDFGDVVGASALPDGTKHAFLLRAGIMRDLGAFGAVDSDAWAINNRGRIVINRTIATNEHAVTVAAVYSDGVLEEIGSFGGELTFGTAINSRGHVAGISQFPNSTIDAFFPFFFHEGQMDSVRFYYRGSNPVATVRSINERDEIVGAWHYSFDGDDAYGGFLYRDGEATDIADLLPPGSGWSIASADFINDAGQIVGAGTHNGEARNYLLSPTESSHRKP